MLTHHTYLSAVHSTHHTHVCLAADTVCLWSGWALCPLVARIQASEILEASMEAGLTLREVEDIVFSNTRTLEFFNSADLEQVRT